MPNPCVVTPAATNPSTPTPQELVQIAKDVSFNTQRALALHMITEEEASALTSHCDARMAKDLSFKLMKAGEELAAAVKTSLQETTRAHPEALPSMCQRQSQYLKKILVGYPLEKRLELATQFSARLRVDECAEGTWFQKFVCEVLRPRII